MKTLYRSNSFGVGRWCIWQDDNVIKFGYSALMHGQLATNEEVIEKGKATRTLQEQIDSRINSRIGKMRDKGYKDTIPEAAQGVTNQLGLISPMLAQKLKAKSISRKIIQPKINGHRCMITCVDGQIVAYSKQGKIIDTIDHITNEFEGKLPEGDTIDGEVYKHGLKLQKIASLVKRKQKETETLVYYAFDYIVGHDSSVENQHRNTILNSMMAHVNPPAFCIPSATVRNIEEAEAIYAEHLAQGFEGSMLRNPSAKYQQGKRSSDILKMKPLFDTEVEVIDIEPSDTGFGLCVCRIEGVDKTFKVLAPGTHQDRYEALDNKAKYIGRQLKVEYRELTADQVPFHAVATEWFVSI